MCRYYVVQFINSEDGCCYFDVIPKNWKINNRTCYWPKNWSTRKIKQAVKNRSEAEDDWMVSQYVKITETYTFEEADYLAGRELIRYNKKLQRIEKQRIKKELIDDDDSEEDVDTEQFVENNDDIVIEEDIGMSSAQPESQPVTKTEEFESVNDCPQLSIPNAPLSEFDNPDITFETFNDLPQLSIPDAPLPEFDNPDIMSLLNEQNPELSFDQVPEFSIDQLPITTNNVQCYQLPQSQPRDQILQQVPGPVCYQHSCLPNRAFTDLFFTDQNSNTINGCVNLRTNQGIVRGYCEPNQHVSKRRRHHESDSGNKVAVQQPIADPPVLSLVYNRDGELIKQTKQNDVFSDRNVECITLD